MIRNQRFFLFPTPLFPLTLLLPDVQTRSHCCDDRRPGYDRDDLHLSLRDRQQHPMYQ